MAGKRNDVNKGSMAQFLWHNEALPFLKPQCMKKNFGAVVKDLIINFFPPFTTVSADTGNFTFPVSEELIQELTSSYTTARIEQFENGATFSSYHVDYFVGLTKGEAIYKTTSVTYPYFSMFDTVEEYHVSFSDHYEDELQMVA